MSSLANVLARIERACRAAGRDPASVRLLAVSKLHPLPTLRATFALGQRAFGENYVQEAIEKIDRWSPAGIEWHFIGRIQTNKIKLIANRFALVHSIERIEVAERLNAATRAKQKIFVQFNVAGEASKGGADAAGLRTLVGDIAARCPKLTMMGLMVMPPLNDDPEATRPFFKLARELLAELKTDGHPLDQLSMGTSGDFEVAIAEGSTWVRIGTDVFGPRP